jgi:hypothetical protein
MSKGAMISLCGFALISSASAANAACVCRCVNGNMEPICESAIDLQPICPPTICGIVPPSIQPIAPPILPPLGASSCGPEQVQNPYTHMYEWRTICH